ncbi:MAG: prepilin-type N-terminal cleavage/methylation domain-containing protein [Oscillospiraceae bacterium]
MKKLFKNKKGFTLVELMVVVAIMAVLVAVAIPIYNNTTEKAKVSAHESNISIIGSSIEILKTDESFTTPTAGLDITPTSDGAVTGTFGGVDVANYIKTIKPLKVGQKTVKYTIDIAGRVTSNASVSTDGKHLEIK